MIVQLELTSRCISKCPACILQRSNLWKDPIDLNFDDFKSSFESSLSSITKLVFCGTKGEILYYHKLIELLQFVVDINPNIQIELHTIAQREDLKFWDQLMNVLKLFHSVFIVISLDGLKDTYSNYRINCSFDIAFNNALRLIRNGFRVTWSFIKFPHNIHQLETCKRISKTLGFISFVEKDAWDVDVPNYEYFKTSIYNTYVATNKQSCYNNNIHSYAMTCDGYIWPCCTIVNQYSILAAKLTNDEKLFMIEDFNIHNNTFKDIINSKLWKDNIIKLIGSGYCNRFICEYLKQEV